MSREEGPHKPAPEPVWEIASRWKLRPDDVLGVGDYKWDLMCAKNAGAPCALLINGSGLPEWGKDAEFVITRLTEVIEIIEKTSPIGVAKHFRGVKRASSTSGAANKIRGYK